MKNTYLLFAFILFSLLNITAQPGSFDYTFNPNGVSYFSSGSNDYIYASAIQNDNKIIVGGSFTLYNSTSINRIVRLTENESIDDDFSIGTGADNTVRAICIQSDNKVLIGGDFSSYNGNIAGKICRLNTNGNFDNTFAVGSGANNRIRTIQIQNDGKILVGGDFTSFNGVAKNRLIRLNTNGSIDTSFQIGTGSNNNISCIAIQHDGKILIGGDFTSYNGVGRNRIARLNSDGSMDLSFNPGSGASDLVATISISGDGKIIVGGTFYYFNNNYKDNRVVRLLHNGSIDNSFNINYLKNNLGIFSSSVQNDGRIILGGMFMQNSDPLSLTLRNNIVRINYDGSIDDTFGYGNGMNFSPENIVLTISAKDDRCIFVGGKFLGYETYHRNNAVRMDYNGKTLSTVYSFHGPNNIIYSITNDRNDNIFIGGGFTKYNDITKNHLTKLTSDGLLNSDFSANVSYTVRSIALMSDDKVIIGGDFSTVNSKSYSKIARLHQNGSLDTNFRVGTGFNNDVYEIKIQEDNKILVVGLFTSYNDTIQNFITRLLPNGSIDTSFHIGNGANNRIQTICIQQDNKILIGGNFTEYNSTPINRIARLNMDGSLDSTFNIGSGFSSFLTAINLQEDGKILVGGSFTTFNGVNVNRLVRLNSNGSIDTAFHIGAGASNNINSIKVLRDGSIIIGGNFSTFNNVSSYRIACLNKDGSINTNFNFGSGILGSVNCISVQSNDKIIIGGSFSKYNNIDKKNLCRIYNNIIKIDTNTSTHLCKNEQIAIVYSASGKYTYGNYFVLELSDSSGSFINPIVIDSTLSTYNGVIYGTIPNSIPEGNSYRMRIRSTNPSLIGCIYNNPFSVSSPSVSSISEVVCDSYTAPDGQIYTTSGIYTAILENSVGCDSVITINLTVKNFSFHELTEVVCDAYTAPDGQIYTTSGIYTAILENSVGCDSVITINLTVKNSSVHELTEVVCDTYTAPDGQIYTTSGIYTAILENSVGCDSVITINLTVKNSTIHEITEVVCDTYTAPDGQIYTTSGIYTAILENSVGCDSVITINLTVKNSSVHELTEVVCDTYTAPDGQIYTTSGIYTATLENSVGCDSVITINLTVKNSSAHEITEEVCDTYTAPDGQIHTSSGIYTAILENSVGCDSVITINLTVKNSSVHELTEVVCDTYTAPDGQIYTTSGIYTAILENSVGCDSVITINLTIKNSSVHELTEVVCDTYTAPDGQIYTTSGIYTAILENSVGCDSVITINLTVKNSTIHEITEVVCDTYTAPDGQIYTTSGIYTATLENSVGCDSVITINLTVKNSSAHELTEVVCDTYTAPDGQIYTSSGTYTAILENSEGCDSVITLNITVVHVNIGVSNQDTILVAHADNAQYQWIFCATGMAIPGEVHQTFTPRFNGYYACVVTQDGCTSTSECQAILTLKVTDDYESNAISIFPNPFKDEISIDSKSTNEIKTIYVYNVFGRIIHFETFTKETTIITTDYIPGVYFVKIGLANHQIKTVKLIKN